MTARGADRAPSGDPFVGSNKAREARSPLGPSDRYGTSPLMLDVFASDRKASRPGGVKSPGARGNCGASWSD